MCGIRCSVVTLVAGAILVVATSIVGYLVIPGIIDNLIISEVVLEDDTIQLERFYEVPFPLNFTIRVFNVSNPEEVTNGGIPRVQEIGPYIYKLYQQRVPEHVEDDMITYNILNHYEFDNEGSFPNSEYDELTIVNLPYHAILQVAELQTPALMGILNSNLDGIFGIHNGPFTSISVRDLMFQGIRICENPGFIAGIACSQIRGSAADSPNLTVQDDNSLLFSLFGHKNGLPSEKYEVSRGLHDPQELAIISQFNERPFLPYWIDVDSVCNMINGTDTGIFPPFVDRNRSLFGYNSDICRSVELRYQHDTEYEGIPVTRFAVNEWFLDNDDGCFCLNVTAGVRRPDGCLLPGAQEMYSCVGSFTVLTYPHFLFAHPEYSTGVIGMTPDLETHRIFLDIEPNTGTVIRGAKRAQINLFLRPISGIAATQGLRTTLTPIFWLEEGVALPEEFVDEVKTKLLGPLNLVTVLVPVLVAASALVLVVGAGLTARAYKRPTTPNVSLTTK